MGNSFIFLLAGLFNFAIALSFASLYFKSQNLKSVCKPLIGFLVINILLALIGNIAGNLIAGNLQHLAVKAGAALELIVSFKLLFRALRTKTINRLFDIGQPLTLTGLLVVLNIDVLLATTGIALIDEFPLTTIIVLFGCSSLAGLLTGFVTGKKMQFIMSNILDLIAAIALAIIGFAFLFR